MRYQADAVTLSPFMGFDSIEPYLALRRPGLILLCRTSNAGGDDLQAQPLASGETSVRAHRQARGRASGTASGRLGLVVGATYPAELARVRELAPTLPLLIPGIGAQGGDWRPRSAPAGATTRRSSSTPRAPCSTPAAATASPAPPGARRATRDALVPRVTLRRTC